MSTRVSTQYSGTIRMMRRMAKSPGPLRTLVTSMMNPLMTKKMSTPD